MADGERSGSPAAAVVDVTSPSAVMGHILSGRHESDASRASEADTVSSPAPLGRLHSLAREAARQRDSASSGGLTESQDGLMRTGQSRSHSKRHPSSPTPHGVGTGLSTPTAREVDRQMPSTWSVPGTRLVVPSRVRFIDPALEHAYTVDVRPSLARRIHVGSAGGVIAIGAATAAYAVASEGSVSLWPVAAAACLVLWSALQLLGRAVWRSAPHGAYDWMNGALCAAVMSLLSVAAVAGEGDSLASASPAAAGQMPTLGLAAAVWPLALPCALGLSTIVSFWADLCWLAAYAVLVAVRRGEAAGGADAAAAALLPDAAVASTVLWPAVALLVTLPAVWRTERALRAEWYLGHSLTRDLSSMARNAALDMVAAAASNRTLATTGGAASPAKGAGSGRNGAGGAAGAPGAVATPLQKLIEKLKELKSSAVTGAERAKLQQCLDLLYHSPDMLTVNVEDVLGAMSVDKRKFLDESTSNWVRTELGARRVASQHRLLGAKEDGRGHSSTHASLRMAHRRRRSEAQMSTTSGGGSVLGGGGGGGGGGVGSAEGRGRGPSHMRAVSANPSLDRYSGRGIDSGAGSGVGSSRATTASYDSSGRRFVDGDGDGSGPSGPSSAHGDGSSPGDAAAHSGSGGRGRAQLSPLDGNLARVVDLDGMDSPLGLGRVLDVDGDDDGDVRDRRARAGSPGGSGDEARSAKGTDGSMGRGARLPPVSPGRGGRRHHLGALPGRVAGSTSGASSTSSVSDRTLGRGGAVGTVGGPSDRSMFAGHLFAVGSFRSLASMRSAGATPPAPGPRGTTQRDDSDRTLGERGISDRTFGGDLAASEAFPHLPAAVVLPPLVQGGEATALLRRAVAWDFDVWRLKELTEGRPLEAVLTHLLAEEFGLLEVYSIPIDKLTRYTQRVEALYCFDPDPRHANPYHNSTHAADVVQATAHFLSVPRIEETLDDLEGLAVLLAAAVHDFRHPGVSSNYLIATNNELAVRYNDSSVLENWHVAEAFALMRKPEFDLMAGMEPKDRSALRFTVIQCVLATDLAHGQRYQGAFRPRAESSDFGRDDGDALLLLQIMLKCADVAHPARPLRMHLIWSDLIQAEFFRQGDLEREQGLPVSPLCDRNRDNNLAKSQRGFIAFVVRPCFEPFTAFCLARQSGSMPGTPVTVAGSRGRGGSVRSTNSGEASEGSVGGSGSVPFVCQWSACIDANDEHWKAEAEREAQKAADAASASGSNGDGGGGAGRGAGAAARAPAGASAGAAGGGGGGSHADAPAGAGDSKDTPGGAQDKVASLTISATKRGTGAAGQPSPFRAHTDGGMPGAVGASPGRAAPAGSTDSTVGGARGGGVAFHAADSSRLRHPPLATITSLSMADIDDTSRTDTP